MEQVLATLSVRDPLKQTICVAGAAMAVQIELAGGTIGRQADVDALCSDDFFKVACKEGPFTPNLQKFSIRWPYGREGRALAPIVDYYPDDSALLPFSATAAMGGSWYPTTHNDLKDSGLVVEVEGYSFLKVGEVLCWTAVTGREKDIKKIDTLLPLVDQLGLLNEKERRRIMDEYKVSCDLRTKYPSRYYARVKDKE